MTQLENEITNLKEKLELKKLSQKLMKKSEAKSKKLPFSKTKTGQRMINAISFSLSPFGSLSESFEKYNSEEKVRVTEGIIKKNLQTYSYSVRHLHQGKKSFKSRKRTLSQIAQAEMLIEKWGIHDEFVEWTLDLLLSEMELGKNPEKDKELQEVLNFFASTFNAC